MWGVLDTLYKRTKTGAIQVCKIYIKGDTYYVDFGQLDGKMQTKATQCFPKNVGKANETSGAAQAAAEAISKWARKTKEGYSTDQSAPVTVQLPQKVKTYVGNESKIKFPAYCSDKLNGLNGTYWLMPDNTLRLTSRGGDEYPAIPHIESFIRESMRLANTNCLNGELYIHGEHLQDITSAVKKPKELSKKLRFRTFELPLVNLPFKDKVDILKRLDEALVPTKINSAEELEECYEKAMANGFEGLVIYNAEAKYKFNVRSSDVYKYKKAVDAEFLITGFNLDKNGHAVYVCTTGSKEFKVKRKGTAEERLADANIASSNIGKWLNIEYEMLSKDGVPLKPVGQHFRNCNTAGGPLE